MPVRLRPEKQILEDIDKYRSIVQKLDDAGDIPMRRTKPSKVRRAKGKKKTSVTKTSAGKPKLKSNVIEELKKKIFQQKPSFMGKKLLQDQAVKQELCEALRNLNGFPYVQGPQTQAKTFEQRLMVESSYDDMVNTVRQNSTHIDFGMLWNILPKNLDWEAQRFSFEYEADNVMAQQSGSLLSGDIDYYFWKLGQTFLESSARDVPLV